MGIGHDSRQEQGPFRPIVAFDFDGTLTTQDSFTAFLKWHAGPGRYVAGLAELSPAAILYLFNRDRGRIKAAAARTFLGGLSRTEIAADARAFAEHHARKLLRPDAVRAWRKWQAAGARLAIVTASPEITVAPFARGLGADVLIGTQLEFDDRDRFTGRLAGPNCRGPEKVRRLREVFGEDMTLEAAYGDTSGDAEMLALTEGGGMKLFRGVPR
jgi:phosphatidylglycerophosphatase C